MRVGSEAVERGERGWERGGGRGNEIAFEVD